MSENTTIQDAAERLARALASRDAGPRDWAVLVDRALAGVEYAVRPSPPEAGGWVIDPSLGEAAPPPGAARKEALRAELARLAGLATCLHGQLCGVASGEELADPRLLAGFRLQAEALLEALRGGGYEEDAPRADSSPRSGGREAASLRR